MDMNEERLATIHENIAAGRAPNEEKAKVRGAVTVFIGNLPFNYGDDEIEAIFEPFGKVFISFIISRFVSHAAAHLQTPFCVLVSSIPPFLI